MFAGVGPHLTDVVGQLDPTGLAPAPDFHLGLDHHRVAGLVGLGHGFLDGVGDPAFGNRDAEPGEVLLALVFEEIHRIRSSLLVLTVLNKTIWDDETIWDSQG